MLQIYKKFYSSSDRRLGFLTQLFLQVTVAWVTVWLTHAPLKLLNLTWATHLNFTAFTSKSAQMKIFIFILEKMISPVSCLREAIVSISNAWYQNCSPFPYFENFRKED